MVPSDQGYAVWVTDFEAEKQEEGFEGIEAAINEVTHEKVVRIRYVAADAKKLHEIMELTMNVAADGDGGVNLDDVAFFNEDLARLMAEVADSGFGNGLASPKVGNCAEGICQ